MRRNSSLGNVGFSARGGRSRRRHGGSSKLPYLILIGILIVLLGIAAFLWGAPLSGSTCIFGSSGNRNGF